MLCSEQGEDPLLRACAPKAFSPVLWVERASDQKPVLYFLHRYSRRSAGSKGMSRAPPYRTQWSHKICVLAGNRGQPKLCRWVPPDGPLRWEPCAQPCQAKDAEQLVAPVAVMVAGLHLSRPPCLFKFHKLQNLRSYLILIGSTKDLMVD